MMLASPWTSRTDFVDVEREGDITVVVAVVSSVDSIWTEVHYFIKILMKIDHVR